MFKVSFDIKSIDKLCDGLKKQLKSVKGARAGYIKDVSYPNGLKVRDNALIQEYGATINVTPKMRNYFRAIGFPLKKTTTQIKIPPRPFIRMTLKRQKEWVKFVKENFDANLDGTMTLLQIAQIVGEKMASAMKDSIDSNIEPANSPMTVKMKKSSATLRDTGLLRNSIHSEVIKNDRD